MPSLYTRCATNLLFPLHERFKGHASVRLRRELERSQWSSTDELEHLRRTRLSAFLREVSQTVPYYQNLFHRHGIDVAGVCSMDALAGLPFLDKELIRANVAALRAHTATNLQRFNTGGSTGAPLVFYVGKERVSHDVAAKWRATRWWNVDIGDPEMVFWGSPIEVDNQDRLRAARDRLLRTRLYPAFDMAGERIDGYLLAMARRRPRMLFGYPSALARVAARARDRGLDTTSMGVAVAFTTGERLYDHDRALIAQQFACPVANGYGSRDAGFIAHECRHGGMHISAEDIIVEIVDEQGNVLPDGEAGEIVVTHMATAEFPFIRYRTGDVAVRAASDCACGRALPLLRHIDGRTTDFIVASDGTVMHGLALIYVLRDLTSIHAFKIIQEKRDLVRVLVVPAGGFDDATVTTICAGFQQRLGSATRVQVESVDHIEPDASGKYRYVVNRIAA